MLGPSEIRMPQPAWGVTSLVLGVIALLLFFLPVLGIPLALLGVIFGVIGVAASFWFAWSSRRWSLAGLATSCLALGINVAITFAPPGYLHDPAVPRLWQAVPDRPFAPPPASEAF